MKNTSTLHQSEIFVLTISAVPIKQNATCCLWCHWTCSSSTINPSPSFGLDVCYRIISTASPIKDQRQAPFPSLGLKVMKNWLQTFTSRFHRVSHPAGCATAVDVYEQLSSFFPQEALQRLGCCTHIPRTKHQPVAQAKLLTTAITKRL